LGRQGEGFYSTLTTHYFFFLCHVMAFNGMGCHITVYIDVLSFCITIAIAITVTVNLDYYVSTASLNVLYSILIMPFDNSYHLHRIE
jgi:hypothetical protein